MERPGSWPVGDCERPPSVRKQAGVERYELHPMDERVHADGEEFEAEIAQCLAEPVVVVVDRATRAQHDAEIGVEVGEVRSEAAGRVVQLCRASVAEHARGKGAAGHLVLLRWVGRRRPESIQV